MLKCVYILFGKKKSLDTVSITNNNMSWPETTGNMEISIVFIPDNKIMQQIPFVDILPGDEFIK